MKKAAEEQKRDVGDLVTTFMNGEKVSWVNTWDGTPDSSDDSSAPAGNGDNGSQQKQYQYDDNTGDDDTYDTGNNGGNNGGQSDNSGGDAPPVNPGWGRWGRQAFYDAESGISDGLAFMNHFGGEGSGVFDKYVLP